MDIFLEACKDIQERIKIFKKSGGDVNLAIETLKKVEVNNYEPSVKTLIDIAIIMLGDGVYGK